MLTAADAGLSPFRELEPAWRGETPSTRLANLTAAGRALHDALRMGPKVRTFRACDLVTLPYPAAYGLAGGTWLPFPFVWLQHRMLIVRFEAGGKTKTLLFNPTDHLQARKTPFFWNLAQRYGEFLSNRLLSTVQASFTEALARAGVRPEEVDYVAFDHLHTQDIRRHAGTLEAVADFGPERLAAALPNAFFLIPRREWAIWEDPHPLQRAWFVPGALKGLDRSRVVLLDGDCTLGDGCLLVSTPGHTMGNQSLVAATVRGVFVTSENGVSADCYAPRISAMPGLRRYAAEREIDLVLNSNTLESALIQYESMTLERAIAGPAPANPSFCNVYPSSELTPHLLAPGLTPSFRHGEVKIG